MVQEVLQIALVILAPAGGCLASQQKPSGGSDACHPLQKRPEEVRSFLQTRWQCNKCECIGGRGVVLVSDHVGVRVLVLVMVPV